MYRLNSLNADIQLIVDGAWASKKTCQNVFENTLRLTIASVKSGSLAVCLYSLYVYPFSLLSGSPRTGKPHSLVFIKKYV